MTPVMQTIFSVEPAGDCFRACVASIFDAPIVEVPHFLRESKKNEKWTDAQWAELKSFAKQYDQQPHWSDERWPKIVQALKESELYYIAFVHVASGDQLHCVVMHKGSCVHDPWPGGVSLAGDPEWYLFFMPLGTIVPVQASTLA